MEYLRPAERFTSSHWLDALRSIPRSQVYFQIRQPLIAMTLVSVAACIWHCVFERPGLPTLSAHTLLGSGLSLLLVFRTNSAYQRFQEGRKIWNDILDLSRDIAFGVSIYRSHIGSRQVRIVRNLLQAFPFAMQRHVHAQTTSSMQNRLESLLQDDDAMQDEQLQGAGGRSLAGPGHTPGLGWAKDGPLFIVSRLLKVLSSIPNSGELFSNRERVWLLSMVTSLSHTIGRCERLVQTPVPLSYARHTSRFLSMWTLSLSWALVESLRWWTVPMVVFTTWALFGILEIGQLIEDPFRRSIDLTSISEAICHDCALALPFEALPEHSTWRSSNA